MNILDNVLYCLIFVFITLSIAFLKSDSFFGGDLVQSVSIVPSILCISLIDMSLPYSRVVRRSCSNAGSKNLIPKGRLLVKLL